MTLYLSAISALLAFYALISWRDLRHGLFLLAAALPTYLLRFEIAGIPFTFLEAMILAFVAIWAMRSLPLTERGRLGGGPRVLRGWLLPMGLMLLAATVGVVVAQDTTGALGVWKAYFVEPMLLFLIITNLGEKLKETRDKNSETLFYGLAAGGLFVAGFAIVQYFTGWGLPAPWDLERRIVSVFPYPNAVGLYLGPIVVIGVGKLFGNWKLETNFLSFPNFYFLISSILSFIAIVLAQSEAAVVAVVATLFVAGVADRRARRYTLALAAVAVLVVALSPFRQTVLDKLAFNDYSGQVRRSQWRETVAMLEDHALLGAGLNGYPAAMAPYHMDAQYEIFQYPHTLVLNIWTELGLLGLVAFALLAIRVVTTAYYQHRVLVVGLLPTPGVGSIAFLGLLAMTVHSLADVAYFKNDLAAMTWILLAILAANNEWAANPTHATYAIRHNGLRHNS